ncbi:MAG: hypothetical protein RJA99_3347 [Pseudomonadota bacterium]|jgi:hypothetical protein
MTPHLDAATLRDSFRAPLISVLRASLSVVMSVLMWAVVTTLALMRPLVALALVPIGYVAFYVAVLGGFLAQVPGIHAHRWEMLFLGLGAIFVMRLFDGIIGGVADAFRDDGAADR